ncbi:MAG: hypothetical protein PHD81_04750 [Candidatus Nanoarchaeia archaeon]|nr:hypothetical protein [Candidatus Nanoarchaeia archaeon]MDD5588386.1 hypothetical protein [Candidatus Nanoarchaeia archaeon]
MEIPAEIKQKLHYDELTGLLKSNLGNQILIINMQTQKDDSLTKEGGSGRHPNMERCVEYVPLRTKFRSYLGIINGEKVEYKENKGFDNLIIPTNRHVHKYYEDADISFGNNYHNWGLLAGSIMLPVRYIRQTNVVNMNKDAKYIQTHVHGNEINFLFGENVELYFKGDNSYNKALELLKVKP